MRAQQEEYLWHLKLIVALCGKIPQDEFKEIVLKYQKHFNIRNPILIRK